MKDYVSFNEQSRDVVHYYELLLVDNYAWNFQFSSVAYQVLNC